MVNPDLAPPPAPRIPFGQKGWRPSLTQQIMAGLVVGCLLGWLRPAWALQTAFLRDIFLNLIKSLIAPLIFSSVVAGIAGGGDAKKVGRLGFKALVYFEAATTLALVVGLLRRQPGQAGPRRALCRPAAGEPPRLRSPIPRPWRKRWSMFFRRAWSTPWRPATCCRSWPSR